MAEQTGFSLGKTEVVRGQGNRRCKHQWLGQHGQELTAPSSFPCKEVQHRKEK